MVATIRIEELLGSLSEHENKNAPPLLYYSGDTSLVRDYPCVSIVGSRKASREGLRRAAAITRTLVDQGVVIVSGLALGIDTIAHSVAIERGGKTVAVMGTPMDQCNPQGNQKLKERIASEHLLLTQFEQGTRVYPSNFPVRNRTMALVSNATIIVEASEKSGTLHQGYEALRLGRPLFIMESAVDSSWAQELIKYGAEPLSRSSLELFFEMLPQSGRVTELTL